jgi:hypothetical protein
MDSGFLEEEIEGLLQYLYTRQFDPRQRKNPVRTYIVADYFRVPELRAKAAMMECDLIEDLLKRQYNVHFKERCYTILGKHPDTDLERGLIKVLADNILAVKSRSGAWDELKADFPSVGNKILDVLISEAEPALAAGVKRTASVAFDDKMRVRPL